jgi:hypothetical protein
MANDLTNDERSRLEAAFQKMDTAPQREAPAAGLALPREDFCKYWPQVKGVLQFVANLPVPQTVKDAINLVIKAGDTASGILCG